jgi:type I restriction enzyme S subunit
LVSRANTRELVGSAAVVPEDYPNLLLCDKLYRLRVIDTACDPRFVAAFLRTPTGRSQIELHATGASSSMLNIGQSVILELPMPIPPVDEQRTIMRFVVDEQQRIEQQRVNAQRAINLLKERRSAFIAAAVTGQIDVRGAVEREAA